VPFRSTPDGRRGRGLPNSVPNSWARKRGIPEIGNRKRGRLSKVERYAKAAKVIGPLGVKVLFEGFPGEKAMPLNEEFEGDLEKVWDPRKDGQKAVRIPCPATGPGVVRQLAPKGE
jgi:hypothetical protein